MNSRSFGATFAVLATLAACSTTNNVTNNYLGEDAGAPGACEASAPAPVDAAVADVAADTASPLDAGDGAIDFTCVVPDAGSASDAESGGACNALTAPSPSVSIVDVAGIMPIGTGGTIQAGTYLLTSYKYYPGADGGAQEATSYGATIVVTDCGANLSIQYAGTQSRPSGDDGGTAVDTVVGSYVYALTGKPGEIVIKTTCLTVDGTPIPEALGPTQPVTYTAIGSELRFYDSAAYETQWVKQ